MKNEESKGTYQPHGLLFFVLALAGLFLIAIGIVGGYYAGRATLTETAERDDAQTTAPTFASQPTSYLANVDESKISWLATPQPVTPTPTLFSDFASYYQEQTGGEHVPEILVEQVGSYDNKLILTARYPVMGMDYREHAPILLLQDGNRYSLLLRHSADLADYQTGEYSGPKLASNVALDNETVFALITSPATLRYQNNDLYLVDGLGDAFFDEYLAAEGFVTDKLTELNSGTLYTQYATEAPTVDLSMHRFVLRKPNGLASIYQRNPDIALDDYTLSVDWNDGKLRTDPYRWDGAGSCGNPSMILVWKNPTESDLQAVGLEKNSNREIFAFTRADHPIVDHFYTVSGGKGWRMVNAGQSYEEFSFSKEEYAKAYGVLAYKDQFDRMIILINTNYGPAAECGKPVVYLYPTQTTKVDVRVGADITISEPAYGDGWHVTAEPNGALTLADGSTYASLFWEGYGHGTYPNVNQGFVVGQHDLETTLRSHLKQLGLTEKESADFLEFWLPNMPKTPYVRLTWLGTKEMDHLAPLTVLPQPDTSIRIFLDFAGLEQPIDLPPQHLSAPPRQGFTLVEWGGLLRK